MRGWCPGDPEFVGEAQAHLHVVEITVPQEMREAYDELAYLREHELRDLTLEERAVFDALEADVSRNIDEAFLFGTGGDS